MARVDFKNLEKFAERLSKIEQSQIDQFSEAAIKELAARLLRKVVERTHESKPVKETVETGEVYKRGKKKGQAKTKTVTVKHGGTLRRGWTVGEVVKSGGNYTIEVINPTEYASYVEFGHRGVYVPAVGKTLHLNTRWTKGQFMLTMSEQELERDAPRILEQKLTKFLGEVFK